jgi:hypothetical protein
MAFAPLLPTRLAQLTTLAGLLVYAETHDATLTPKIKQAS